MPLHTQYLSATASGSFLQYTLPMYVEVVVLERMYGCWLPGRLVPEGVHARYVRMSCVPTKQACVQDSDSSSSAALHTFYHLATDKQRSQPLNRRLNVTNKTARECCPLRGKTSRVINSVPCSRPYQRAKGPLHKETNVLARDAKKHQPETN